MPVQMNLTYVRSGPKPRQKDGPVRETCFCMNSLRKEQTQSRCDEPTWNTFLLCVVPNKQQQADEEDQGSGSCRGTRWSWRSGILGRGDQLRHLSVQTDSSHYQITHQIHENTEKSCFSKSGRSLFMQSGLVQGDAKATTDQQNVNKTHATLRGCLSSATLSIDDLSWYIQLGNSSVETLFELCLTVRWRKAQIWISLNIRIISLELF